MKFKLCFLFSIAVLVFVLRGPYRAIRSLTAKDFAGIYAAARCWIDGKNPYDHVLLSEEFIYSANGPSALVPTKESQPSVYFPTAMPILAALAWLPWSQANKVWCLLSIVVFALSLLVFFKTVNVSLDQKWLVATALLAYAPIHTGLATGNPSVITNSLVVLTISFSMLKRPVASGILLGIAQCVKPQLSICALTLLVIWKSWLPVLVSLLVTLVAAGLSLVHTSSVTQYWQWCLTLRHNLALSLGPGGINDPSLANPLAYHLLNAQALLGLFTRNPRVNDLVVWTIVGAMAILYFRYRSNARSPCRWRDAGFISVVTILITYHRYYDAQLLILVIPFLLTHCHTDRVTVISLCVCLLLLTFPSQSALAVWLGPATQRSLLGVILFRHQPLAVLAMGFLLVPWSVRKRTPANNPNDQATRPASVNLGRFQTGEGRLYTKLTVGRSLFRHAAFATITSSEFPSLHSSFRCARMFSDHGLLRAPQ
jgi:hypothetical protein